jgi:hypothetical protein
LQHIDLWDSSNSKQQQQQQCKISAGDPATSVMPKPNTSSKNSTCSQQNQRWKTAAGESLALKG